jgi:ankyrin repeat protein
MSDNLINASISGNMKKITELLDSGADPNYKNAKGVCALIEAFEKIKVVELLLNRGADPNIQDRNGNTALLFAAINNKTKVVDLLLNRGADPNIQDNVTGNTPLLEASKDGYGKIVELLLSKGANPNIGNKHGFNPMEAATRGNHKSVIKMLKEVKNL